MCSAWRWEAEVLSSCNRNKPTDGDGAVVRPNLIQDQFQGDIFHLVGDVGLQSWHMDSLRRQQYWTCSDLSPLTARGDC